MQFFRENLNFGNLVSYLCELSDKLCLIPPVLPSYTCNSVKNNSLQLDMRKINMVELSQDPASPTGLAATLGAGGTWGAVLRAIPTTRQSPPLSLVEIRRDTLL